MSNPSDYICQSDQTKKPAAVSKPLLASLFTVMLSAHGINAQAKDLGDVLPYLAIPAGIAILGKTIESVDAAQKAEQAKIQLEEQNRKAEQQRRLAEAERQRKQAEYDQWFASLSKDQQVQVVKQQEQTQRNQQEVQGAVMGIGIDAAARLLGAGN